MYSIDCPAKINLWLKVRGKRDDGFHELETMFCQIDLQDQLHWTPGESEFNLEVQGADLGDSKQNLVTRALRRTPREVRRNWIPTCVRMAEWAG